MQRRTYVATVGAALAGGCLGLGGRDGQGTDGGTGTPTGTTESGGDGTVRFERQWQTDLGIDRLNMTRVSTATRSDTVYTTHDRGMTALSLADGDERWARPTTRPFDALAADDDGVFAVWTTGELLAVDPDTGDLRWERGDSGNGNAVYGPVVTTAEHVAAEGPEGIVVYGKASGQRVATLGESGGLLAAYDGGFLVDASAGLTRYAPDGTVDWQVTEVPYTFGYDASLGETGLVVAGDTAVIGVDPADGSKRWTESVDADFMDANVTTAGGVAFFGGGFDRNAVYAVEISSGTRLWDASLDGMVPFPMVALDSALIVEDDDQAQARDLETGEVLDSISTSFEKSFMGTAARGRTFVGVGRTVYGYRV
ncbi:PQQ-binding-like beta-propeller repeat protein [Halorientalis pallida]|uniref:outer membrane protein assembly factor BamB family protein n=1 Tax=Halorientalis pallida TaxID=2479928 RepID=UPI003C6F9B60